MESSVTYELARICSLQKHGADDVISSFANIGELPPIQDVLDQRSSSDM